MRAVITLDHLKVENANAIAGMTYGFPAISSCLGFTHALSRKLMLKTGLTFEQCAVVCHEHQVHAHEVSQYGDRVFALTRNPLQKDGSTASFNEEGRMHITVSILIGLDFDADDLEESGQFTNFDELCKWLKQQLFTLRFAGGTIVSAKDVRVTELIPGKNLDRTIRKLLMQLVPGFLLVDRTDLLTQHHEAKLKDNANAEFIDSWLDFVKLTYHAKKSNGEDNVNWGLKNKPASGWLVPISVGFKGISPLHVKGEVKNARDPNIPFQFVESIYSIGQWLSPHRIRDKNSFEHIFWQYDYQQKNDLYLCHNSFHTLNNAQLGGNINE